MLGMRHSGRHPVAIFDIGSGSVAAAILEQETNKPSTIVVCERLETELEEREPEHLISALSDLLQRAGTQAIDAYHQLRGVHAPLDILVTIRAPWVRSSVLRASTSTKNEEKITDEAIEMLAKQARAQDEPLPEQFLSAEVTNVLLNGYPTEKAAGEHAHLVEIATLVCACHPKVLQEVRSHVGRLIPGGRVQLRSGTRALIESARLIDADGQDCLIVEMDGEGTSVIVLRDGMASEQLFVPEGVRSLLHRVSNGSAPETLSMMRMLGRGECEGDACADIETSFAKIEPDLVRSFGEAFAKVAEPRRLPNKLILIASPDLSDWMAHFFARIDFSQFTVTMRPFDVHQIEPTSLEARTRFGAETNPDIGVLTASTLINTT